LLVLYPRDALGCELPFHVLKFLVVLAKRRRLFHHVC
jgi:hypothetical protein